MSLNPSLLGDGRRGDNIVRNEKGVVFDKHIEFTD
jgi:hypothetical protein